MAFVYWIKHKALHTNLTVEGYIGVTVKPVEKRFAEHVRSTANGSELHVHRAMRKHGPDVEVITLLEASEDYCYFMENRLRPSPNIGWNMNIGGCDAPRTGAKLSLKTRAKLRHNNLGKTLSPEWRAAMSRASKGVPKSKAHAEKISSALQGVKKSPQHTAAMSEAMKAKHAEVGAWEHGKANKIAWAQAVEIYNFMSCNSSAGSLKVANHFGLRRCDVATIHRDISQGWNPTTDQSYLDWLSQYNTQEIKCLPTASFG